MKNRIFSGAGVALITPFNADGSVNFEELKALIEFQIENGTDSIITCGTTGESSTLTEEEHIEVVEFTVKVVAGRIPVIAGAGSNDTRTAIKLCSEAKEMGADGLLLITPYYNKTSQKGLVEHFTAVANAVDLPQILYNAPSRTGVNILPETYEKLSHHKNIVAIKEANGDIGALAKTISLCGDRLEVYSGDDNQTLPIMALGGIGVISVLSNILPATVHDLTQAMFDEDYTKARAMSNKYLKLMNAMFIDVNPIPVKEASARLGFCSNHCRLPLTTMEDANIDKLVSIMKEYDLI